MNITRRGFVLGSATGLISSAYSRANHLGQRPPDVSRLFTLGVASGDPHASGVVLWTRIAPEPLADSQLKDAIPVTWAVSRSASMREPAAGGTTLARPGSSHCIHVEAEGLAPDTEYYYQFEALGEQSRVGRTRTLPSPGTPTDTYSIAVVSCQDYSAGYFTAYRDIVSRNPDLIIHLGDYIYETGGGNVRSYPVDEAMTLADYRAFHAQTRLDPDLQNAHAQFPWMLIWDDHEVVNDWGPEHFLPSSRNRKISHRQFLRRKEAALQAYLEYMPIRRSRRDRAGTTQIHDRTVIGNLIELNRLDTRSFRHPPVCELDANKYFEPCAQARDPSRSLLGNTQETWLREGFGQSGASWNCLVQSSVMAPLDKSAGPAIRYEADSWDNYSAGRDRITDLITEKEIQNAISVGGNIHTFYAGVMFDRQHGELGNPVLTELVTTSVTASGGGEERFADIHGRLDENPGIQYFDNRYRGYSLLIITPASITAVLRVVDDIENPNADVRTLAKLNINSGRHGVSSESESMGYVKRAV